MSQPASTGSRSTRSTVKLLIFFPLGSICSNLNANLHDVTVLSVINRCILLNARIPKNKLCEFNTLLSDDYYGSIYY